MTIDFQESLLRFLFQDKQAKKYKEYLDQSVFDIPTWQLVYSLWYNYVNKYSEVPQKSYFIEYIDRAVKKSKGAVTKEVYAEILNTVAVVYMPQQSDYNFVKDTIIEFVKRKRLRNWTIQNADKIKNSDSDAIDAMIGDVGKIVRLGEDTDQMEKNRGGFLFRDGMRSMQSDIIQGNPTFLHGLNKMTAARGFYSPQLILLLGSPKAFKTGTILSILIEYARIGKKVFIADAENGLNSMRTRIKQGLLECERDEVDKYKQELIEILRRIKQYGGDIYPHFFPAKVSSLDHVDAELDRLWDEEQWKPDIIFYDYLQLFASANKKVVDNQLRIQDVYHHAIRLNNKWDSFAFTAAPVTRSAVSKMVIKVDDFGVDFAQAYNCHATFALCRTEDEVREGNARLIPVVQREGTAYKFTAATTCALSISEATQTITELDAETYMAIMEEQRTSKTSRNKKWTPPSNLSDD